MASAFNELLAINPRAPVARTPALMSHHLDTENIAGHAVVQGEREANQYKPTQHGINRATDFWTLEQQVDGAVNFGLEAPTQPCHLELIVGSSFDEFQLRFRVELQLHLFRRARRFSNT